MSKPIIKTKKNHSSREWTVKDHYSLGELKGIDLNSLNQRYQVEVSKAVKIKEYYQAVCSYFA